MDDILKEHFQKHRRYSELLYEGYSHQKAFIEAFGLKEWDYVQNILSKVMLKKQSTINLN